MIIVVLILAFMPFAAADPLGKFCGTSGNYTANSTYQANLEHLSTILPNNISSTPNLFVKGSLGAAPDIVYGLALCRGDANSSACNDCVAVAFQDAQRLCAYNKDVTIFYDPCILRFSNQNFIDPTSYTGGGFLILMNTQNITEPLLPGWDPGNTVITSIIRLLTQRTAIWAAYNSTRMYATGRMDVSSTFPTLFSMAQCTPDLLPPDCWDCLQNIINMATKYFSRNQGGRILGLRCNFRYEIYPFYQGQPMQRMEWSDTVVPPPPPPPPPPPVAVLYSPPPSLRPPPSPLPPGGASHLHSRGRPSPSAAYVSGRGGVELRCSRRRPADAPSFLDRSCRRPDPIWIRPPSSAVSASSSADSPDSIPASRSCSPWIGSRAASQEPFGLGICSASAGLRERRSALRLLRRLRCDASVRDSAAARCIACLGFRRRLRALRPFGLPLLPSAPVICFGVASVRIAALDALFASRGLNPASPPAGGLELVLCRRRIASPDLLFVPIGWLLLLSGGLQSAFAAIGMT